MNACQQVIRVLAHVAVAIAIAVHDEGDAKDYVSNSVVFSLGFLCLALITPSFRP